MEMLNIYSQLALGEKKTLEIEVDGKRNTKSITRKRCGSTFEHWKTE
jgi:hypothetical protein